MTKPLEQRLRQKGWTEEDIKKASSIIQAAAEKKPDRIKKIDKLVYWAVLVVTIIGNTIISIILIPFLLALKNIQLYIIITTIALTFGFLFDLLIRDLQAVEQEQVIIAWIFIPAIAIINVFFMTQFSNHLIEIMMLKNIAEHNPLLIGAAYTLAFICPYLIRKLIDQR